MAKQTDLTGIKKCNHQITVYAANALKELKKKTGKPIGRLVTEAIVLMAKAEGVLVHEPKGENKKTEGLLALSKKQAKLEETLKSLSRLYCEDVFEGAVIASANRMVKGAVDRGTERNAAALWKKLGGKLADNNFNEDDFIVFTATYGIPKKDLSD